MRQGACAVGLLQLQDVGGLEGLCPVIPPYAKLVVGDRLLVVAKLESLYFLAYPARGGDFIQPTTGNHSAFK